MKRQTFVPAVMQPKALYVAVCTALGRPHYGPFTIMRRVT